MFTRTRLTSALALLLMATLTLTGCAGTNSQARDYGTGGALAGGLIGALTAGDKVEGALIGAGAGLLLGYIVGNELDKQDQTELVNTLETQPSGQPRAWQNPDTGYEYQATPAPAYVENDRIYRDIEIESEINGKREYVQAKAWRDDYGNWHLVQ